MHSQWDSSRCLQHLRIILIASQVGPAAWCPSRQPYQLSCTIQGIRELSGSNGAQQADAAPSSMMWRSIGGAPPRVRKTELFDRSLYVVWHRVVDLALLLVYLYTKEVDRCAA